MRKVNERNIFNCFAFCLCRLQPGLRCKKEWIQMENNKTWTLKNIAGMLRCNCYFLWGQNFDCQSTKYLTMISACLLLSNNDSFIPSPKTYTHAPDRARIVYICILAIMFREAFSHRISFAWTEIEIQTAP